MATNVRYTAFFGSDDGWGWSESHAKAESVEPANLQPLLADFANLIQQFRIPLLGKDRYCVGVRVSFGNRATGIKSSPLWFAPSKYPANQREGSAPHLSAKVRMGESGNVHFSDINLRGFWDVVEQDEELNFNTAGGAAWKTLADQYTGALVNRQYGWLGTNEAQTRRGNVTSYTNQPDGRVRFTVDVVSGPALPAVGTRFVMRVAGLNHSSSVLNTTHIVTVIDADTVQTVPMTAALVFQSAGTFVATAVDFYRYTGVQYWKLAKRAAGAPFGHTPGRRRARAKG